MLADRHDVQLSTLLFAAQCQHHVKDFEITRTKLQYIVIIKRNKK